MSDLIISKELRQTHHPAKPQCTAQRRWKYGGAFDGSCCGFYAIMWNLLSLLSRAELQSIRYY